MDELSQSSAQRSAAARGSTRRMRPPHGRLKTALEFGRKKSVGPSFFGVLAITSVANERYFPFHFWRKLFFHLIARLPSGWARRAMFRAIDVAQTEYQTELPCCGFGTYRWHSHSFPLSE
jgi:hypothetical protein